MIKFKEKRQIQRKPTKNIVVLYHNDCTDGFSAAWAAWRKLGSKADYIGIDPGSKPIEGLNKKGLEELGLKPFFRLHPPRGGIESKKHFGVGKGVLGDNKKLSSKIEPLSRMQIIGRVVLRYSNSR